MPITLCTLCTGWFLRRGGSTRIMPGMYGYGKMPYVVSSQRDPGQPVYSQRQRRSPPDYRYGSYRQQQKKYRNTQQSSPQNTHHSMSQQASWVPLHQPSSGLRSQGKPHPPGTLASDFSQASAPGRPHNPLSLPASSCSGVASQYKMCNMNVRILNISLWRVHYDTEISYGKYSIAQYDKHSECAERAAEYGIKHDGLWEIINQGLFSSIRMSRSVLFLLYQSNNSDASNYNDIIFIQLQHIIIFSSVHSYIPIDDRAELGVQQHCSMACLTYRTGHPRTLIPNDFVLEMFKLCYCV